MTWYVSDGKKKKNLKDCCLCIDLAVQGLRTCLSLSWFTLNWGSFFVVTTVQPKGDD